MTYSTYFIITDFTSYPALFYPVSTAYVSYWSPIGTRRWLRIQPILRFYHDLNNPYSLYRNIVSLDHVTQTPSSTTTSTSARARPRTRTTRGSPSRRATPPSSASWPSSSPSTSSGGRRPPCQRCSCYGRSSRSEIQGVSSGLRPGLG